MVQRKHNSRDSARCVNNGGDLSLAQPPFIVKPVMIGSIEQSPQRYARVAGVLYLAIIALGAFGELGVRGTLVVPGDAAATWARIGQSPWLWRCGIVGDLLMHVLDVPVLVILYVLLRPAGHGLALMATAINLVQTAVLVANKTHLLLPLFLLEGGPYLGALSAAQLQAMAYLAIRAHAYGFGIGLIFFGVACLVRAWLIVKCGYLPRWLGALMAVAGLSYLFNSLSLLLPFAGTASITLVVLLPAFVGELALALWLVFKGVDEAQWERQRLAVTRR